MRRAPFVYALIPAIFVATAGLAYYAVLFSREVSNRQHRIQLDFARELGREKVLDIQLEIETAERAIFDVDRSNPEELLKQMQDHAVETVVVLDSRLQVVPSGLYTKVQDDKLRDFFTTRVIPQLELQSRERGRVHLLINDVDYVISFQQQDDQYVVVQFDHAFLFTQVFPQVFSPIHDKEFVFKIVDEYGQLVWGYPFSQMAPDDVVDVQFGESLPRWHLLVAREADLNLRHAAEEERRVRLLIIGLALVVILAGVVGMIAAVRRERRLSEMKSDFISNVSHELKTPLSIISMFGELLAMGRIKGAEQGKEYGEIIRRESVRLTRLIDNVLDFAKIERGVDPYEFREASIATIVDQAAEILRPRLDRAKMTLDVTIEPELPTLSLDDGAITLAILNLVDNAIKYASDGGKIEMSVRRVRGVKSGRDRVVLAVADFGPGIPVAARNDVFKRFFRVNAIRREAIRGSGIGLSLVKHIALGHGGGVQVEANEPTGCLFSMWIPVSSDG